MFSRTSAGFAAALRDLIGAPGERAAIGRRNREEALARYDVPVAADLLTDLFNDVLAGRTQQAARFSAEPNS